jgi:hypothetical protein
VLAIYTIRRSRAFPILASLVLTCANQSLFFGGTGADLRRRLKSHVTSACHFEPSTMSRMDRSDENPITMGTP